MNEHLNPSLEVETALKRVLSALHRQTSDKEYTSNSSSSSSSSPPLFSIGQPSPDIATPSPNPLTLTPHQPSPLPPINDLVFDTAPIENPNHRDALEFIRD